MEILLVLVFAMGLALGWMLAQDSRKRLVSQLKAEMVEALDSIEMALEKDKANWLEMAQQLESKFQREREKVKVLESDLRWERVQRMHPKKKLDHKK